jgi:uncharacterized delta-60 repeat protein
LAPFCSVAGAAPGDTDRSFGREGFVNLDTEAPARAYGEDMAFGSGGMIYVLRSVESCSGSSSCSLEHRVERFLSNGSVDRSYGAGGTSSGLGVSTAKTPNLSASLGVGTDGRAVVAWIESGKLVLQRLGSSGAIDTSFGSAGTVKFDFGFPLGRARVAVQADGRIVVAAEPEAGYAGDAVVVARFTATGALDPAFGGGAPVLTALGSGFGGMSLSPAGALLLGGPRCCSSAGRAVHLVQIDASGAFQAGFGHEGQLFVDDVTDAVSVGAVVVLPSGRIYVVGSGQHKGDAFALRLLPGGKLDHSFGHGGIAYMRRSHLNVAGAAVDRAGRLLVFGSSLRRLAVLRRLSDGRPDPSFAGGAIERLSSRGGTQAVAGGLQDGSKLVVLANAGECSRECPVPLNFLVRFIGGTATSRCAGHRATIVGTREDDELIGTRRRDVIVALAGDDLVRGRGGDDVICGGRGNDKLIGGPGRDVLRGGAGHNRLHQ